MAHVLMTGIDSTYGRGLNGLSSYAINTLDGYSFTGNGNFVYSNGLSPGFDYLQLSVQVPAATANSSLATMITGRAGTGSQYLTITGIVRVFPVGYENVTNAAALAAGKALFKE